MTGPGGISSLRGRLHTPRAPSTLNEIKAWLDENLVKNNFYADKFDTTAWNDFGAEPRAKDFMEQGTHNGSRHAMFNLKKIVAREKCQGLMNLAEERKPKYSTKRTALIPNAAIENS